MKKLVFMVVLATMMLQVQAQDKKVKFGVKAGLNLSNNSGNGIELLSYYDTNSSNSKFGMSVGGFVEYTLSENFSFQPELLFSQQGHKEKIEDFDHQIRLGYINVPLLMKYKFAQGFSMEMGPQIGFLTSAKHHDMFNDGEEETEDVKDYFKTTDFGLDFGLEYQFEHGFGINARYNLGLKNIIDYSSYNYIDAANTSNSITKAEVLYEEGETKYSMKNRVFSISVFYAF